MDNNLIEQIAISVIITGKASPSQFGALESDHVKKCREIYAVLTNKVNVSVPFEDLCRKLLNSMQLKPTNENVFDFVTVIKEQIKNQTPPEVFILGRIHRYKV